jgi:hypothetical protein
VVPDEIVKNLLGRRECSSMVIGPEFDGCSLPQNLGSAQRWEDHLTILKVPQSPPECGNDVMYGDLQVMWEFA